ncbi:F0F1 ATP synthase subunit B [Paenibacillus doosanensis]|uniref:ATP synthase subunit b n=1 Tax=Paenibacillus konkukensis TaxID=2020716 RepID=A0ABY4RPQ0_9BACL|nr:MULTISPECIES: F0F1 ATP synthase subunit B [Paenibacillus]MCS7460002.1 F0F1 ATP synthase subunit B [Paenibacillus doosanensis]UQZ84447.1 ATP synthase subunit b [Paenibacillus konkukensis]
MNFIPSTFIIQLIAFLVLYFLLSKYAFGPLFGMMEKRRTHIQDQIQSAEQNRKESEQLLNEQKEAIQQARKEAYDMIEQAKVTSSKQADEIILQAKNEATRLKDEALRDIENEKNKAIAALRSQVSAMSVMIASKIIEKQIDEKSQEQLVEHYLKEVGGNQ